MTGTIFKNDGVATQLSDNGWAIIDFCETGHTNHLKQQFQRMLPELNEMSVIITLLHKDRKITKQINDVILNELTPALDAHFANFKIPIALFFAKRPSMLNDVGLHQDPMITDQVKNPSYGLWIPLVETGISNGTLAVLSKSHRWFHPFQADTVPSSTGDISNQLIERCTSLQLKPGQAVIMDNRLIHYSHPNTSAEIRPSVVIKLTHISADYLTLYTKNESIYLVKSNEGFYLDETWIYDKTEFPSGEVKGILNFTPKKLSIEEYEYIEKNNVLNYFQTQPITAWIKESRKTLK